MRDRIRARLQRTQARGLLDHEIGTKTMLTIFSYSLAGGILAILGTARMEDIAWKFVRLMGLFVVALVALMLAWSARVHESINAFISLPRSLIFGTGLIATVVVAIAPRVQVMRRSIRILCLLGGVMGLLAAATQLNESLIEADTITRIASAASEISAGLLLGSITVAWLLGHAYLTATKMTIEPLRHFSRTLVWAIAIRILLLGAGFLIATFAMTAEPSTTATSASSIFSNLQDQWLIASLRIGLGLMAVGVFSYMVVDCVKLRATQSATGILYFGSIFAYIGELASLHLTIECHWPM